MPLPEREMLLFEKSVSVIIPTYNRKPWLPHALHSVFEQTAPLHEIIVVDDGSEDGTSEMIQDDFPQVKVIQQAHRGVSAARNCGIRTASGTWIALLDSDDRWVPDKIARQLNALDAPGSPPLCHTNEIWIRKAQVLNQKKKHLKKGGWIFRHCLPLCCISPSSALIEKRIFETLGYFDEALPACEDYDLWLRICARYPVLYIDEPLTIKHGGHADQLSKIHWGMDRFRVAALDKILCSGDLNVADRQAARLMLHQKCKILLKGALKHRNLDLQASLASCLNRHPLPGLKSDQAHPLMGVV